MDLQPPQDNIKSTSDETNNIDENKDTTQNDNNPSQIDKTKNDTNQNENKPKMEETSKQPQSEQIAAQQDQHEQEAQIAAAQQNFLQSLAAASSGGENNPYNHLINTIMNLNLGQHNPNPNNISNVGSNEVNTTTQQQQTIINNIPQFLPFNPPACLPLIPVQQNTPAAGTAPKKVIHRKLLDCVPSEQLIDFKLTMHSPSQASSSSSNQTSSASSSSSENAVKPKAASIFTCKRCSKSYTQVKGVLGHILTCYSADLAQKIENFSTITQKDIKVQKAKEIFESDPAFFVNFTKSWENFYKTRQKHIPKERWPAYAYPPSQQPNTQSHPAGEANPSSTSDPSASKQDSAAPLRGLSMTLPSSSVGPIQVTPTGIQVSSVPLTQKQQIFPPSSPLATIPSNLISSFSLKTLQSSSPQMTLTAPSSASTSSTPAGKRLHSETEEEKTPKSKKTSKKENDDTSPAQPKKKRKKQEKEKEIELECNEEGMTEKDPNKKKGSSKKNPPKSPNSEKNSANSLQFEQVRPFLNLFSDEELLGVCEEETEKQTIKSSCEILKKYKLKNANNPKENESSSSNNETMKRKIMAEVPGPFLYLMKSLSNYSGPQPTENSLLSATNPTSTNQKNLNFNASFLMNLNRNMGEIIKNAENQNQSINSSTISSNSEEKDKGGEKEHQQQMNCDAPEQTQQKPILIVDDDNNDPNPHKL